MARAVKRKRKFRHSKRDAYIESNRKSVSNEERRVDDAHLTRTETEHAELANAAYDGRDTRASKAFGYEYVPEYSDEDLSTYHNAYRGDTVLAFRGSHTWRDWLVADAKLAGGASHLAADERFMRHSEIVNRAAEHYGTQNLRMTGHSLGGTEALYHGIARGIPTNAFNPGSTPVNNDLTRLFRREARDAARNLNTDSESIYRTQHVHHIEWDAISAWSNSFDGIEQRNYAGVGPAARFWVNHNMERFVPAYDPDAQKALDSYEDDY